jgi:hypothetical protein
VPLSISNFDNVYLDANAMFQEWLADFNKQMFQPVALMALGQQIRQLPEPVQAQLRKQSPDAWERLFGAGGVK